MNLPIKIKNKKPWISVDLYADLFVDSINFDSLKQACPAGLVPEGYFSKGHLPVITRTLENFGDRSIKESVEFYKDTLEVFFYNLEVTIDKLLDLLYFNHPINDEDINEIDKRLEEALNGFSKDDVRNWKNKSIKRLLNERLSNSFLDFTLHYNTITKTAQSKILFRYLPNGVRRDVVLDLVVDYDGDLEPGSHCYRTIPEDLKKLILEKSEEKWIELFQGEERDYLDELYRSIMSDFGGISLDSYYVKSYEYAKHTKRFNPRNIESHSGFKNLESGLLKEYSLNIITKILNDTYNEKTINSGFNKGLGGWNKVSKHSQVSSNIKDIASDKYLVIENLNKTKFYDEEELYLGNEFSRVSQINRLRPGKYELELAIKTEKPREIKLFLGKESITFTMPASTEYQKVRLTDQINGGLDIRGYENNVVEYGFELEGNLVEDFKTGIEYCNLKKL